MSATLLFFKSRLLVMRDEGFSRVFVYDARHFVLNVFFAFRTFDKQFKIEVPVMMSNTQAEVSTRVKSFQLLLSELTKTRVKVLDISFLQ